MRKTLKRISIFLGILLWLSFPPANALTETPCYDGEPLSGDIQVEVPGTYYIDSKKELLNRLNEIRYEACLQGVPDPRNSSRNLTLEDYTPVLWSSDLEEFAIARAVEVSLQFRHERLGSNSFWPAKGGDAECLARNMYSETSLYSLEQYYQEKTAWVNHYTSSVTVHYTTLIDPDNRYVGMGAFYAEEGSRYNASAARFSASGSSEEQTGKSGRAVHLVNINVKNHVTGISVTGKEEMSMSETAVFSAVADLSFQGYSDSSSASFRVRSSLEWESSDESVLTVSDTGTVTAKKKGTATVTVRCPGTSYSASMKVEVNGLPYISGEPENAEVYPSKPVSFKVTAGGENLQYQWYYRTSAKGTWQKCSAASAKTDTYSLTASQVIKARNGYQYRCVVQNAEGSVTSAAAVLTVKDYTVPVILQQPSSVVTGEKTGVRFQVICSGDDVRYQWYYRISSAGVWKVSTASSAKTDTYSLSASQVVAARNGYEYRCVVSNPAGEVITHSAALTVVGKPEILTQPSSCRVSEKTPVSFTVKAAGEYLSYQWYYRINDGATWKKCSAACAETDTYTLEASSVIAARNGYEYRCVISNPAGEVISETAVLTVVPVAKPVIQTQPRSQTVTQGKAVSFRVVASGENLSYQWYYRTSASGTWMKSTASCAKTSVYSLSAASVTTARSGYQYRCVVTNPGGQVTSSAAILTVNP